jgi:hypothetical protein
LFRKREGIEALRVFFGVSARDKLRTALIILAALENHAEGWATHLLSAPPPAATERLLSKAPDLMYLSLAYNSTLSALTLCSSA